MSSSRSAWVCTKIKWAPCAAAANSSATRALRYFCCVAVTSSTSHFGRIARKRAKLLPAGRGARGEGRGASVSDVASSSVVSGSGQSTTTRSRSAGKSRSIDSTVDGSMPSISGVRPGRHTSVGRVVVGRDRPVCTTSAPTIAFTSALLPVPVPPRVATTSGASSRTRNDAARSVSRRTNARHFSAGCHAGASPAHRLSRSTRASTSASNSKWASSDRVIARQSPDNSRSTAAGRLQRQLAARSPAASGPA